MKISAYVCVRNAIDLDYCLKECIESLLPVCDEMVVCDGESIDGTLRIVERLMADNPKIRILTYPWPFPHNQPDFWVKWLNFARSHLKHPMQLTLDADEVLHPASYPTILEIAQRGNSAMFERLNFWKDGYHLAPENRVCGTMVARMGPSELYMPSDEPMPANPSNVRANAGEYRKVKIFHYGFIRNATAFGRKSRAVQNMFFGSVDPRITDLSDQGKDWADRDYFDGLPLQEYHGDHPPVALHWLKYRGRIN